MTLTFVLPAVVALLAAAAVGAAPHRLSPPTATRLLTAAIATSSAAAVAAASAVGFAYVSQIPRLAMAVGWCQAVISRHDRVPPEFGLPALLLLAAMVTAGARAIRRRRRATTASRSNDGVEILHSDQPLAYAVPGRPGHVVVSVGMIRRLDAEERRAMYAHEQAHLTLRHHRYLAVAEVATAALPLLRPLRTRLRLATERWAVEAAAHEVGDRRLVARAITRAALAGQPPGLTMAFTGTGVADRVDALLDDHQPAPWLGTLFAGLLVAGLAASITGSGIQLHHLAALIDEICT